MQSSGASHHLEIFNTSRKKKEEKKIEDGRRGSRTSGDGSYGSRGGGGSTRRMLAGQACLVPEGAREGGTKVGKEDHQHETTSPSWPQVGFDHLPHGSRGQHQVIAV